MAVRIAVVGAHGTGKTTLVERLAEEFKLPIIPESSRIVAESMGIETLDQRNLGPEFQWSCLQVQERNEWKHAITGFVADRGWPDYVAYPLVLRTFYHQELAGYLSTTRKLSRSAYDLVVQPIVEFPLEEDGFRHKSMSLQTVIDELIWSLTPGMVSPRHLRVYGTVEERVGMVWDYYQGLVGK